jgi:hypothetical protein
MDRVWDRAWADEDFKPHGLGSGPGTKHRRFSSEGGRNMETATTMEKAWGQMVARAGQDGRASALGSGVFDQ